MFEQHLNAGDLDAVMALYDPGAVFVQRTGETVLGRQGLREVVGGLIAARTRFQSRGIKAITVDDVALLYTDFQGTTMDHVGEDGRGAQPCDRGSPPTAGWHVAVDRRRPQQPRIDRGS